MFSDRHTFTKVEHLPTLSNTKLLIMFESGIGIAVSGGGYISIIMYLKKPYGEDNFNMASAKQKSK